MRIAINATLAGPHPTGIGVYSTALASALPSVDGGGNTYDVFVGALPTEALDAGESVRCHVVPAGGRVRHVVWETWGVGRAVARIRADLLHSTSAYLPWGASCPCVLTIHDLAIYRYPEAFRPANRLLGRRLFESAVRRAASLIAVSEATRHDIMEYLGVAPERITTIPEAVDAAFQPVTDPTEIARVRRRYGLTRPYMLSVGTAEPRKNLLRLLSAFETYHRLAGSDHQLVLVGGKGWLSGPIETRVRELERAGLVRTAGYVPRDDLPALYAGAAAVAYPSLYEGFGLPVLEALACAAPVLTSNCSSLPEVAGDAAVLVDPTSLDAIVSGLRMLIERPELAVQLRQRGPTRAAQFTWESTARATLQVYARAVASCTREPAVRASSAPAETMGG